MSSDAVPSSRLRLTAYNVGANVSGQRVLYNVVPVYLPDQRLWLTQIAYAVNGLLNGRSNNTGEFTLTLNSSTTVVSLSDDRINNNTIILLVPLTANAATEFGAGSLYISSKDPQNNQFTVTHVNSATTGRKFGFVLIG